MENNNTPTWESTEQVQPGVQAPGTVAPMAQDGMSGNEPTWDNTEDVSQYETPGQMLKTAAEGAAEGVLGPLAPLIETKLLRVKPEDIRARETANPMLKGTSEVAGLVGSTLIPGGQGRLMTKAGAAAAEAVGLGAKAVEAAPLIHKVGSAAVREAAEAAIYQAGDEISKMVLKDPNTSAENAIANIGIATALGGLGGAAISGAVEGAISPLWKATVGPKLESTLGAMRSRLNGDSGDSLVKEAKELGLQSMTPDVEAAMSENPFIRNQASVLRQSDTTKAGRGFQEREAAFQTELKQKMASALGADDLSKIDTSEFKHGTDVGEALKKEYGSYLDPVIKQLNETKAKFKDFPLNKDQVIEIPTATGFQKQVTPGTVNRIKTDILDWANKDGLLVDDLSPKTRFIKTQLTRLDNVENLGQLADISSSIRKAAQGDYELGWVAGRMRNSIRDIEDDLVLKQLELGPPEALLSYREGLQRYRGVGELKDILNDQLKISNEIPGFARELKEAIATNPEKIVRRLSGTNNAHILGFLSEKFPSTAEAIKKYHVENLIEKSMTSGEINPTKLIKNIKNMSPELRDFTLGKEKVGTIERLNALGERLKDHRHNFSNTARTIDKLMSASGGNAIGLIAALSGAGGSSILAPIAMMAGNEGTAAVRLSLMKFLGSEQQLSAEGFKAAMNYVANIQKAARVTNTAAQNVFKRGAQVLSASQMPNEKDREKLDKTVANAQQYPERVLNATPGGQLAHYMPEQQTAMTAASVNIVKYLQSLKPHGQKLSPLDKEMPPSKADVARYNRALDIANQPAVVFSHIKNGTLQVSDLQDLKSMYPALYTQYSNKLMDQITNKQAQDEPIPYKTRISTSLFLGQPLDSTMAPQSIMAAQPQQPQSPQMPGGSPKKAKNAPSALGKTLDDYKTPLQAAEANQRKK